MADAQGQFFTPQGAPIADVDLAKHLQDGTAMAHPGQAYQVRDEQGQVQTVKGDQIGAALSSGWSVLPKAEAAFEARRPELESFGNKALTAVERGIGTATFGASDVLARNLAPGYEDEAALRARANPGEATLGNIVGMIAPGVGIGKGAAGLVGKVLGAGEAATPMARMAIRAAQGASAGGLEGALYGGGGAAGQAALQGDDLTAEKVLSGMGHGALFGALLGGGGAVVADRLGALFGEARGALAKDSDRLMQEKISSLEEKLRKDGASEEKIAARVAEETQRAEAKGNALQQYANSKAIDTLDASPKLRSESAARAGTTVDELVQQAGADYLGYEMQTGPLAGKRIFHGAKNPIDVIDDVKHAIGETRQSMTHFEEMADRAIAERPELAPQAAPIKESIIGELMLGGPKKIPDQLARTVAQELAPVLRAGDTVPIAELRAARESLDARIASTTSKPDLERLSGTRRALDAATNDATSDVLRGAGLDTMAYSQARRVNQSLNFVHDAIEEMRLDTKSGGHDSGLTGYALAATLLGHFPHSLTAGASLLAHKVIESRAGQSLIADVASRVASSDVRLGWGAKALAGDAWGAARRLSAADSLSAKAAPTILRRVQEIAGSPQELTAYAARQVEPIARQYPELGQAMTMKIIGDLQHLAARAPLPVGRSGSTLTPAAVKSFPSAQAATDWMQRAAALRDPGFVVDELLKGRVPTDAIETLKERRPLIWEKLRADIATETAARGDELPFKRRITLGLAFEFAADASLKPGATAAIQTSFAPVSTGSPGMPGVGSGRMPAPKAPDISNLQSMTERIST